MTSIISALAEQFGGPLTKSASNTLGLPFKTSILPANGSVIYFDATPRETHTSTLTLTDHPVEEGSVVTDHAQSNPDELEINGLISNRPIVILASINAKPSVQGGDPNARAQDAYREFVRLMSSATLLFVSTELKDYEDMVITSVVAPRDKETREILDINLRLRRFRKATVESVEAPEPVEPVHKAKRKRGKQQMKPASEEVSNKADSLIARGVTGTFGVGG